MTKKISLFAVFFLLVCPVFSQASETLEHKLATIDAGRFVSPDDITVARFRSLLNQLSSSYVENKTQISDMSVTAQKLLRDDGIQEKILNIMEGMNSLFSGKYQNLKYAEYAAAYVTLRSKGNTHQQAIEGLQAILRAMQVY